MPTEQLYLQRILAMDADNSWDGVLERLKLQSAWLTIELCYSFLRCKMWFVSVLYRVWTQQDLEWTAPHPQIQIR